MKVCPKHYRSLPALRAGWLRQQAECSIKLHQRASPHCVLKLSSHAGDALLNCTIALPQADLVRLETVM